MNPAAANKGANIANILGAIDCRYDPSDSVPAPAEVFVVVPISNSPLRYLIGGVCTSCIFIWLSYILQFVLAKVLTQWVTLRQLASMVSSMLVGFLLPTAVGFAVTLLLHATVAIDRAAAVVGFTVMIGAVGVPAYFVITRIPSTKHLPNFERYGRVSVYYGFLFLADGLKDTRLLKYRLSYFEDLLTAVAISVIAAIKPQSASCYVIAGSMFLVAALHLAYVTIIRPLESLVEGGFAILIAFGQVACGLITLVAMKIPSAVPYLGMAALAQMGIFMIQTVVTVGFQIRDVVRRCQRRNDVAAGDAMPLTTDTATPGARKAFDGDLQSDDATALLSLPAISDAAAAKHERTPSGADVEEVVAYSSPRKVVVNPLLEGGGGGTSPGTTRTDVVMTTTTTTTANLSPLLPPPPPPLRPVAGGGGGSGRSTPSSNFGNRSSRGDAASLIL